MPAPWEQVRPAVAKSAVALFAGLALELALRRVGRVVGAPRTAAVQSVRPREEPPTSTIRQVTEALYIRRVTRID
jgi:hypothetical protein